VAKSQFGKRYMVPDTEKKKGKKEIQQIKSSLCIWFRGSCTVTHLVLSKKIKSDKGFWFLFKLVNIDAKPSGNDVFCIPKWAIRLFRGKSSTIYTC
jgi:hypothetical protein